MDTLSPSTRAFFTFCIKRGYCTTNPAAKIDPVVVEDGLPMSVYKPAQVKQLLRQVFRDS